MFTKATILNALFLTSALGAAANYQSRDGLSKRFDGTCNINKGAFSWSYTISIPGDGHPGCGGGLLDNLHGQSLTISAWNCNPGPDNVGIATFYTTIDTNTQVNAAFQAAYGGTAGC